MSSVEKHHSRLTSPWRLFAAASRFKSDAFPHQRDCADPPLCARIRPASAVIGTLGGVRAQAVLDVLSSLSEAGCRAWVAGGWGVDALVGEQTRQHRDLDLALDAEGESRALTTLGALGYVIETDWRPARVELAASGSRWVDLHPVCFAADGHGRQADLDGGVFEYLADCFAIGRIRGSAVPCLSVDQQLRFREGFELRDVDRHDLALLAKLKFGSSERDETAS